MTGGGGGVGARPRISAPPQTSGSPHRTDETPRRTSNERTHARTHITCPIGPCVEPRAHIKSEIIVVFGVRTRQTFRRLVGAVRVPISLLYYPKQTVTRARKRERDTVRTTVWRLVRATRRRRRRRTTTTTAFNHIHWQMCGSSSRTLARARTHAMSGRVPAPQTFCWFIQT